MKTTDQRTNKRRAVVAIGIACHTPEQMLEQAVESSLKQANENLELHIFVLDNSPCGFARDRLNPWQNDLRISIHSGQHRDASSARNQLIVLAETHYPNLDWHVRLDADDTFVGPYAISRALSASDDDTIAILAGNRQINKQGDLVGRNMPTPELKHPPCLIARLRRMAAGDFSAELPSCNLTFRAFRNVRFPDITSAEDHWLVTRLLLMHANQIKIIPDLEMVNYRVEGKTTAENRHSGSHRDSRYALLEAAINWANHD